MNNTVTQQIIYLGAAALGLLSVDSAQRLSRGRLARLDRFRRGAGKFGIVFAVVFFCSPAGAGMRDFVIAHFLEPARIGLEAAVSNIDSEDVEAMPCAPAQGGQRPPACPRPSRPVAAGPR